MNFFFSVLKRIGQYCSKENFKPDIVGRVSFAAKSLCMWVRAMEMYGRVYRVVEPKKKKLEQANKQLAEKQANLHDAKEKLRELKEKLEELQRQYEEKLATKEDLRKKAELTELKLDRAAKVVTGLAGERVRWEESIKVSTYTRDGVQYPSISSPGVYLLFQTRDPVAPASIS